MGSETPAMTLKAIGTVRSGVKKRGRRSFGDVVSEIVVDRGLTEALDNLDDFSHIIVICWMHRSAPTVPMKVHPRGRKEIAPVGVFASRSPDRPNPLGKTTVRLLERRGNVLTVKGLDAIDGTPVIDIKPYIPKIDAVDDAATPPWINRL